jgi:hypothetical protein
MKRIMLIAALLFACGKKEESKPEPKAAAQPSASAAPSAEVEKPKGAAAAFKGSYTAKQAEVRTPSDAPSFIHPESKDGIGAGQLELSLPASRGEVTGKGTGALGAQTFSGWLEDGRLTGTLHPTDSGANAMWGLVDATVEGSAIKGTIRTSGGDGRVVREASFTLNKAG